MLALRIALTGRGLSAIPVLEADGAALFIPFADAPAYDDVRAWLHDLADAAVARHAVLLTADPHDHKNKRVHVNVGSNAVGRFSSLPYALLGGPELHMATPIAWEELERGAIRHGQITAANSADRFAQGDVFHRGAAELASQRFADASA
jgi:DNA primase